jgi:hypothetical protein
VIAPPLIARPTRPPQPVKDSGSPGSCTSANNGTPIIPSNVEGQPAWLSSADPALAEALAKVKTPADDEVAKQQQAFDQMMQLRVEQAREMNAIREFGIAQQKKENDFLADFIRMI